MALAPLSQTIFLTEDGSIPADVVAVNIPPLLSRLPAMITTPAAIANDGTPTVDEQLTGIDPVARNGTITRRRWMSGETVLAETAVYTPKAAATIRWVVDILGNDGITIASSSTIIVASVTPTAPAATVDNTLSSSSLPASEVSGYPQLLATRQARLAPLEAAAGITAIPFDNSKSIAFNEALTDARLTALEEHASQQRAFFSDPFFTDPFFRDAA